MTIAPVAVMRDILRSWKEMILITDERIEIIWLPTYSVNLNLIERLWKLIKEVNAEKQILWNGERLSGKNQGVYLEHRKLQKSGRNTSDL